MAPVKSLAVLCALFACASAKALLDDIVTTATNITGEALEVTTGNFSDTKFVLRTSTRNATYDIADAAAILSDASYSAALPTAFYMHGYEESSESDSVGVVARAMIQRGSHNLVIIDWGAYAGPPYPTAVLNLLGVSEAAGDAVDRMVKAGLPKESIWLIGHSLGGQMSGLMSRHLDFTAPRITALDPALPGYNIPSFPHLTRDDADLVDVIHTDAGVFGYNEDCGDIDLWPNGGTPVQPGCGIVPKPDPLDVQYCGHHRSYYFFAESVNNDKAFPAVRCASWDEFKSGACPANATNIVYLGYSAPATGQNGTFFLTTNDDIPFARAEEGLLASSAAESSDLQELETTKTIPETESTSEVPVSTTTSGLATGGIANFFEHIFDQTQNFFSKLVR